MKASLTLKAILEYYSNLLLKLKPAYNNTHLSSSLKAKLCTQNFRTDITFLRINGMYWRFRQYYASFQRYQTGRLSWGFSRALGKGKNGGEPTFIEKIEKATKEKIKNLPEWEKRERSLIKRYGQWNPTRKLSRQQIQDIRDLKEQLPHLKTIDFANHLKISPEAIRRVLKSKWVPNDQEEEELRERAERQKIKKAAQKDESTLSLQRENQTKGNSEPVQGREFSGSAKSTKVRKYQKHTRPQRTNGDKSFGSKDKSKSPQIRRPYVPTIGDRID